MSALHLDGMKVQICSIENYKQNAHYIEDFVTDIFCLDEEAFAVLRF